MRSLRSLQLRSKVSLGVGAALALGVAFGSFLPPWEHFEETRRFVSVQPGMTEDEVLAAMGAPPGQPGSFGAKYGRDFWEG